MNIDTGSSKPDGRGRNLDVELNIVPFIDLLSCCIAFLLMTAVWLQISSINVSATTDSSAQVNSGNKDLPKEIDTFKVSVTKNGYTILQKEKQQLIPMKDQVYDYKSLDVFIKNLDKKEKIAVIVSGEDQIFYEEIIKVMDIARENALKDVSIGIRQGT